MSKKLDILMHFDRVNHLANLLRDSNKNIHFVKEQFVAFMLISFLYNRANIVSILGAKESICHGSSIRIPSTICYSV